MPTYTQEEFPRQLLPCYWPQEFTKRRQFDRQAENQPYLEFLKTSFDDCDEDGDFDYSSDGEDGPSESIIEDSSDDKEVEACSQHTNVRLFMKGITGNGDNMQYRDQVEQVASFCEQAKFREVDTETTAKDRKGVALLDDRNNSGTIPNKQEHCRPYLGPLTSQQLREALSRKVVQIFSSHRSSRETHTAQRFRVKSDQNVPTSAFGEEEIDAERRIM